MSDQELSKVYDPEQVEARWYARWRDSGYFQPSADRARPPFTVVLPPPNVTGRLHMGHALTATIEDTLVRWHRMRGYDALWLPGTDHAGIATQMMVERQLASEGTSRQAIGREAFLERTWAWKEAHGGVIDQQHERLGASLDWSRYRFTMDEVSSRAVREAFVRLHEQGLVYRDYRLINWDWGSQTAVSDLEVEPREVEGKLWHLAYPVEGSDDTLVVATTRPETMLGDSGIAVHPEDPRYQHLVGRSVVLPITGRKVPIVADPILVDMAFGTGAVKVTPAHDFNDFETGKRHELELIQIIDQAGRVCAPAPERFVGLDVQAARAAVLAELEAAGAVVKVEPHAMKVGHSQRSGVVVEPLPSTQWFVKVGPLAEPAIAAVREGRTRIIPEHRNADYFRWMENIHDWCISRQLWWGHRIPAWYCEDCGHVTVAREDPSQCAGCGSAKIAQDEDVLDTWFSSGLWPLTTLGWPDNEDEVAHFYPTSLMETGWDILFFWVARMMMFGLHFGGDVPFRTVFLHSMVLGEDGRKMSKTKGNVVDPVELIEEYGTDALRFYLATMGGQEHGIVFSRARVEGYRNFCNKLWNAARFAQMKLEGYDPARFRSEILDPGDWEALAPQDRWILARAVETCVGVDDELSSWRLDLAAHRLYQFVWRELCDWYLELAKENLREDADPRRRLAAQGTLATVLDLVLRALHPFTPFVTEEIWTRLPGHEDAGPSLMLAAYPEPERDAEGRRAEPLRLRGPLREAGALLASPAVITACEAVELAVGVITRRRNLAAGYRIPPAKRVDLVLRSGDPALRAGLEALRDAICFVGRVGKLDFIEPEAPAPAQSASDVVGKVELFIPLEGLVDVGAERARMAKEVERRGKEIAGLEGKLANPGFVGKAPPEVVDKERARLEELREQLGRQRELLSRLGD